MVFGRRVPGNKVLNTATKFFEGLFGILRPRPAFGHPGVAALARKLQHPKECGFGQPGSLKATSNVLLDALRHLPLPILGQRGVVPLARPGFWHNCKEAMKTYHQSYSQITETFPLAAGKMQESMEQVRQILKP